MRISLILSIFIIPQFVAAAHISVYSGQEVRSITALSAEEIKALENGDGMGFAKPAELNHYPGPKHVLDLADELGLTLNQRAETQLLYQGMHKTAVSLGQELVFEENTLGQLFSSQMADADVVRENLVRISELRAKLRYVHLEAHLRQRKILDPAQISKYDNLRGYQERSSQSNNRHNMKH